MGAVNLVNVSSILMQNGGWQLDAVGSATAIFTVDADKVAKINAIYLCNTQATDETVNLSLSGINTSGVGTTFVTDTLATPSLLTTVSVPANTTIQVIDNPIYLLEADTMSAFGGASDNDLHIFASWEAFTD